MWLWTADMGDESGEINERGVKSPLFFLAAGSVTLYADDRYSIVQHSVFNRLYSLTT